MSIIASLYLYLQITSTQDFKPVAGVSVVTVMESTAKYKIISATKDAPAGENDVHFVEGLGGILSIAYRIDMQSRSRSTA